MGGAGAVAGRPIVRGSPAHNGSDIAGRQTEMPRRRHRASERHRQTAATMAERLRGLLVVSEARLLCLVCRRSAVAHAGESSPPTKSGRSFAQMTHVQGSWRRWAAPPAAPLASEPSAEPAVPAEQPEQAATRPPARRGAAEPTVVSGKRHRQRRGRLEIAPRAEELGGAYSRIQPAVLRSVVSLSTPTGSPTARRGRAWSREDHMCGEARRRGSSPIGGLGAGGAGAAAGGTSGCSGSPIKPSPHAKSPGAPSPCTLCGHVAAG